MACYLQVIMIPTKATRTRMKIAQITVAKVMDTEAGEVFSIISSPGVGDGES